MTKLSPVKWQVLRKVFEAVGFVHERTSGSHFIMVRAETKRPLVIQKLKDVPVPMIKSNLRTAGLSTDEFLELLTQVK